MPATLCKQLHCSSKSLTRAHRLLKPLLPKRRRRRQPQPRRRCVTGCYCEFVQPFVLDLKNSRVRQQAAEAAAAKKAQDDAKDNRFCVEHKGFVYRALAEGWDPHQSQKTGVKDQSKTLLALPSGYHIAPNEANCIEVVASHGWDTHCMVLADGSSVCTKSYSQAGKIDTKNILQTEGDKFRPQSGRRGILIRKRIL